MTNGRSFSNFVPGIVVKVGFPLLLGLIALVAAYVGGVSGQNALILAAVVAFGAALIIIIIDTERRTSGLHDHMERGFVKVDRASELAALVENSAFDAKFLTDFLDAAGRVDGRVAPLLQRLAERQIESLTSFMRHLPVGTEISYEGEDRDWMLGLTLEAEHTIDGISLSTVDAGMRGFDGGLWTSDLGTRYLELQREAIARGVRIRRIFIFESEDLAADDTFLKITKMQRKVGIEVRMLDQQLIPEAMQSMIFDFIVFDGAISYEMTPATAFAGQARPAIVRTLLAPKQDRARELEDRFQRLWQAADPEREIEEEK